MPRERLSPRSLLRRRGPAVAMALVTSQTVAEAAKATGLDQKTIYNWACIPWFAEQVELASQELRRALAREAVEAGKVETPLAARLIAERQFESSWKRRQRRKAASQGTPGDAAATVGGPAAGQ